LNLISMIISMWNHNVTHRLADAYPGFQPVTQTHRL
jgi:hypothetical protein